MTTEFLIRAEVRPEVRPEVQLGICPRDGGDMFRRPAETGNVWICGHCGLVTHGDPANRARRRAISVLPTPVGPIIKMFLGITSSAISGVSFLRRMRLRSAIATARLARDWPTTKRSNSTTI